MYYNKRKTSILPNHKHIYTNGSVAVLINCLFVQLRNNTICLLYTYTNYLLYYNL